MPGSPPTSGDDEPTATVATFPTTAEAEMVRELLERNGIEASISGESDPIGTTSGAVPIELRVAAEDLQRASELYDAYFQSETADAGRDH